MCLARAWKLKELLERTGASMMLTPSTGITGLWSGFSVVNRWCTAVPWTKRASKWLAIPSSFFPFTWNKRLLKYCQKHCSTQIVIGQLYLKDCIPRNKLSVKLYWKSNFIFLRCFVLHLILKSTWKDFFDRIIFLGKKNRIAKTTALQKKVFRQRFFSKLLHLLTLTNGKRSITFTRFVSYLGHFLISTSQQVKWKSSWNHCN